MLVRLIDPKIAANGARNPLYAVMQICTVGDKTRIISLLTNSYRQLYHAQSGVMRSVIGEMELDGILHDCAKLNSLIEGSGPSACII